MKASRFNEEQIIGILREQESGHGRCVPQARDQQRDVLQVEGEVLRPGCDGGASVADAGGRECKAAGRGDAGQRDAEVDASKNGDARCETGGCGAPGRDVRGEPAAGVNGDWRGP